MSNLAEQTYPINPERLRVELSHHRELLLDLEPGKADRWRIALVRDHGTHKMCSGVLGGLTRSDTLEVLMGLGVLAHRVDVGGLPGE